MNPTFGLAAAFVVTIGLGAQAEAAITITSAQVQSGAAVVEGKAAKNAPISWEGAVVTMSKGSGSFLFAGAVVPPDCVGTLSDGASTIQVPLAGCVPQFAGGLVVTGQTTAAPADKNDGIAGAVAVADDGTLRRGLPFNYQDNGDGTVLDLNTALVWEKKLPGDGSGGGNCNDPTLANRSLHCVNNGYLWSGDGSQETIWDWLDDLNASNFAGHSDWRIPNVRELESIKDYSVIPIAIPAVLGPTGVSYWSSTTFSQTTTLAWSVGYVLNLGVMTEGKSSILRGVRAVRGGL